MVLEKQQLIIGNNLLVFFKNFVSAAGKRGKCNVAAENLVPAEQIAKCKDTKKKLLAEC